MLVPAYSAALGRVGIIVGLCCRVAALNLQALCANAAVVGFRAKEEMGMPMGQGNVVKFEALPAIMNGP